MRLSILGFLLGVMALQQQATLPALWWWPLPLLVLPLSCGLHRTQRSRLTRGFSVLVALIAAAALGFAWAAWRAERRLAETLPHAWEAQDIKIAGVVASLPQINERGIRFEFDVEQCLTAGAVVPRHIALNWYSETQRQPAPQGQARNDTEQLTRLPPDLQPGERWQLTVRLRRPHGNLNPHGFDFEAWALERNIRATGYVRTRHADRNDNRSIGPLAEGWAYRIDRLRSAIRTQMNRVLQDSAYRGVLVALAIGEQGAIPSEQWRIFWRTGVGHLMSISGLHITMVASLFYWLAFQFWARGPARALHMPAQRVAALVGAGAAFIYSLLAGFSVPTQRTFFMLLTVAVALWIGRTVSASRLLCIALFVVVLYDPWAVLAPGFWLSFGAVAAIFYVNANRTGQFFPLKSALRTQLAVTLGLLPMTLALFQQVSLVSPLANAIAIPVVSLIVVPLTLSGAALGIDWPLQLAHLIMAGCFDVLNKLADWPAALWQSHAPQIWTVGLALLGGAWLLAPRGVPGRVIGLLWMLPMFLVLPPRPAEGALWITLLDVGQGLATVVRTAHHTLVYDSGPRYNPDADSGNRIVVPFLRGEGLRQLDALIISHDDEDHTGGARSIIDARNPKWVLTSVDSTRDILAGANETMRCEGPDEHYAGDAWRWDGVVFEILHPLAQDYQDENAKTNNLGCVLKITAPGGTVLMTGDIEKKAEAQLLARVADELHADVLIVPHHGSKTSSTPDFLDAVSPRLALLSVGYRNRFRHPHPEVLARYAERRIAVHRTDYEGALTLALPAHAGEAFQLSGYRRERRRYWFDLPLITNDVDEL